MPRRLTSGPVCACLALCVAVAQGVAPRVTARQPTQPAWRSTVLAQWLDAVEQHVPGDIDSTLLAAARWSRDDLRKLWMDVQVLLELRDHPAHTRFVVPLMETDPRVRTRDRIALSFRPDERAALDALAARAGRLAPNTLVKRAAIVHTDLVTLARDLVAAAAGATPMGAPMLMLVGDGASAGAENVSLHWEVARMLLAQVTPDPGADAFVRDWYRATVALAQSGETFDSPHLRRGLRVFPNDAVLLMLAGCEREALATPLFQVFARSLRNAAMRPDIDSAGDELDAAERFYRKALDADPALVEARVRLGRVLGLRGRHAESVRELRQVMTAPLESVLEYYAALFLGTALEAVGELPAARGAFRRAAEIAPESRVAHLALARIAREFGDREATTAHLDRAVAPISDDGAVDPWWRYRAAQGRRSLAWLDAVRQASRSGAP